MLEVRIRGFAVVIEVRTENVRSGISVLFVRGDVAMQFLDDFLQYRVTKSPDASVDCGVFERHHRPRRNVAITGRTADLPVVVREGDCLVPLSRCQRGSDILGSLKRMRLVTDENEWTSAA